MVFQGQNFSQSAAQRALQIARPTGTTVPHRKKGHPGPSLLDLDLNQIYLQRKLPTLVKKKKMRETLCCHKWFVDWDVYAYCDVQYMHIVTVICALHHK